MANNIGNHGPGPITAAGMVVSSPVNGGHAVCFQFVTGFTGTAVFEQSLDGVTWTAFPVFSSADLSAAAVTTRVNPTAGLLLYGAAPGNFVRVRANTWTAGAGSVLIGFTDMATPPHTIGQGPAVGSVTPADASANPTTAIIDQAYQMNFNGTTWDRARNALGAASASAAASASFAQHVAVGSAVTPSLTAAAAIVAGTTTDQRVVKRDHVVQVTGVFVGTVRLQGSLDNVNFVDMAVISVATPAAAATLDITAPGIYTIPGNVPIRYLRAAVTAFTSGTITAVVGSSG